MGPNEDSIVAGKLAAQTEALENKINACIVLKLLGNTFALLFGALLVRDICIDFNSNFARYAAYINETAGLLSSLAVAIKFSNAAADHRSKICSLVTSEQQSRLGTIAQIHS